MDSTSESWWRGRRVLVTGGSGFIGAHLVRALAVSGATVSVLDHRLPTLCEDTAGVTAVAGDVRDTETTLDILERESIELVFHLAAQPLMGAADRDPARTFAVNVQGTTAVAEAVRRAGTHIPIVYASSGAVYGALGHGRPLTEDTLPGKMSVYGASKLAGEQVLRGYADSAGLTVRACRLMNTYGPGDHHTSRLVPRAIDLLVRGCAYDFGPRDDGSSQLDFVYVADIVAALLAAGRHSHHSSRYEVLNVATGDLTSVREVARTIARIAGREIEPAFGGAPRAVPYAKCLDPTRARRVLGWRAATHVADGLSLTWKSVAGLSGLLEPAAR